MVIIYVGIDVAKDKHNCCILDSNGQKVYPIFTISNDKAGFDELFSKIKIYDQVQEEGKSSS